MIPDPLVLCAFLGGIAAATVAHLKLLPEFLHGNIGHLVVMAALIGAFTGFPTAYAVQPLIFLAIAFILIAHGTSVFGLFDWRVSRFLGQMTYSIYLLHGVILYWLFHFVLALKAPSHFQPAVFWLAVALCVPFIVAISCLTYRAIELPAMNSVKKLLPSHPTKQFPDPED
jgi:peptidoglycan/LPS O-acetylase OafA/YrhL